MICQSAAQNDRLIPSLIFKEKPMKQYKYLIVGGGLTDDAAVRGIRELDASGSIGLISSVRSLIRPTYD